MEGLLRPVPVMLFMNEAYYLSKSATSDDHLKQNNFVTEEFTTIKPKSDQIQNKTLESNIVADTKAEIDDRQVSYGSLGDSKVKCELGDSKVKCELGDSEVKCESDCSVADEGLPATYISHSDTLNPPTPGCYDIACPISTEDLEPKNEEICDSWPKTQTVMDVEKTTHSATGKCGKTGSGYETESCDKSPLVQTHCGQKPHSCSVCGKTFMKPRPLKIHMKIHGQRPHSCSVCGKCFIYPHQLRKHMKIHTGQDLNMKTHSSQLPDLLKKHMKIHRSQGFHPCNVCQKIFNSAIELINHMKIHKSYQCKDCPLTCNVCQEVFPFLHKLEKHMRKHVNKQQTSHPCTDCPRTFNRLAQLHSHMKIHNCQKMYSCTVCDKVCFTEKGLNLHIMKMHVDRDLYPCDFCGKTYKMLGSFESHMRIHTGQRGYHLGLNKRLEIDTRTKSGRRVTQPTVFLE